MVPTPPVRSAAEQGAQTGWHSPARAGSLAFGSLSFSDPAHMHTEDSESN